MTSLSSRPSPAQATDAGPVLAAGPRPAGWRVVAAARPRALHLLGFVAAYLVGAGFAKWLAIIPGTGISIWPPAGVFFAVLIVSRGASWPWWVLAALLAELIANVLWFRNPLVVAALLNAGNALCALIGAALVRRHSEQPGRLETLRDVMLLLGLGALPGPLASASVGAATLAWAEGQPFARAWGLWWVGDATGILVVAPLVLMVLHARQHGLRLSGARAAEAAAVVALLLGVAVLSLGRHLPFAYLVMPALLWAAVRFHFGGAVVAVLVLAFTAAAFTVAGLSPFTGEAAEQAQRHVMMQLFLCVSALSSLVVAAVARQHAAALQRLSEANAELEQRVAERTAELRGSEQRFRTLADTVPIVIWVTDARGDIEFVNREYERFFGLREAALRRDGWRPLVHPDDEPAYAEAFFAAMRARREFRANTRVRASGGAWRVIASRGVPRLSDAGEFLGMVGCSADITERQRDEDALAEASRQKDEFLAMLAHELRNPLAPIRNAVELLRLAAAPSPTVDGARAMIERQVGHLVRLVDDLLDISRVSRGKITLQRVPLDLAQVVQQAVEMQRPMLQARRHRLELSVPAAPLRIEGDATRLAQAVGNLLNNAAKYTDPGGRIEVALERVDAGDGAAQALIRVRDDGRGIEPEAMARLFEMFYQVEHSLDRAEGGLGIGLALVKRLVELHGGRVEARSEGRGAGTEFTIRLPLPAHEVAAPTPAAAAPGVPMAITGRRILVVDDNRDAADSTAELLRCEGHEVRTAYDGREAIGIALRERPDVVLLDLGLPSLDGYEVCRALRGGGLHASLIVALTGYGQQQDRQRGVDAGFDAHLVKPMQLDALLRLIASH